MVCEHFIEGRGLCGKGMPVGSLYGKDVGFERAGAGLGLFEGF